MDTFSTLKDNLLRHYVAYVPEVAFAKIKGTIYEGMVPKEAANRFFYMFHLNNISENIKDFTIANLLAKADLFESNLFKLFEVKKALAPDHFKVLLDKYYEQVNGHTFAVNWMLQNINNIFKSVDQNIFNLFILQAEQFNKHNTELAKHFSLTEKDESAQNTILKQIKDSYTSTENESEISQSTSSITPNSRLQKAPLKKQKLVIDDHEVDAFLLTTVFNVDP